jgi:hypothetical protein
MPLPTDHLVDDLLGDTMPVDAMLLGHPARLDQEVVELALLLPRWQAEALEDAARSRGMTTGQMLRRVIGDLFTAPSSDARRA